MSSFSLGLKTLRRLCEEQDALLWNKSKLNSALFKTSEVPVFEYVRDHVLTHHALPQLVTLQKAFPEIAEVECPEPPSYYLTHLENAFYHKTLNQAAIDCATLLKDDPAAHEAAEKVYEDALGAVKQHKYRQRILDVGLELAPLVVDAYHHPIPAIAEFGWQHLDALSNSVMAGDEISYVGRPAKGKTWQMLYGAIHNWKAGRNVLFVSMEMGILQIGQRIAAMTAGTGITQLKAGGYSTIGKNSPYAKFMATMAALQNEKAKFYVVDGNLAASAEDIFVLADMLGCRVVFVDGAYMVRHKNTKLDRYSRVAENCELFKRYVSDMGLAVFASWQFSREGSKKHKKGQQADLDDIGYSDVIGQISSIVLGLFEEDGIETMKQRKIRIMKGRNGETGEFSINWNFNVMDFSQVFFEKTTKLKHI